MADKINSVLDRVFLAPIKELFDGKGWHGKGIPTVVFSEDTLKEILWEHTLVPATCNGYETGQFYAVASDNGLPVGEAVGKVYRTPTHKELFNLFTQAIAGTGYDLCSAGSVDSRVEFFLDAKAETVSAGGREVSPYVGLNRMFGGLGKVLVSGHEKVIQCANTTALFRREAMKDAGLISAKNTLRIQDRLPEIQKAITARHAIFIDFTLALEQGARFRVSHDDARNAYAGWIGEGEPLATMVNTRSNLRSINRVNDLLDSFKTSPGNNGENAVDWINGLTYVYTFKSAGDTDAKNAEEREAARIKQWHSSEFGSARNIKAEITSRLFNRGEFQEAEFKKLITLGRKSIKATDKELAVALN